MTSYPSFVISLAVSANGGVLSSLQDRKVMFSEQT